MRNAGDRGANEIAEVNPPGSGNAGAFPLAMLTPRQEMAATLKAAGWSDEQIGDELRADRSTIYRWRTRNPAFAARVALIQQELNWAFATRLRRLASSSLELLVKQVEDGQDAKIALAIVQVFGPTLLKEATAVEPVTPIRMLVSQLASWDNDGKYRRVLMAGTNPEELRKFFRDAREPEVEEMRRACLQHAAGSHPDIGVAAPDEHHPEHLVDKMWDLTYRAESLSLGILLFGEWDEASVPHFAELARKEIATARATMGSDKQEEGGLSVATMAHVLNRTAHALVSLVPTVAAISPPWSSQRLHELEVALRRLLGKEGITSNNLPDAMEALGNIVRSFALILSGEADEEASTAACLAEGSQ